MLVASPKPKKTVTIAKDVAPSPAKGKGKRKAGPVDDVVDDSDSSTKKKKKAKDGNESDKEETEEKNVEIQQGTSESMSSRTSAWIDVFSNKKTALLMLMNSVGLRDISLDDTAPTGNEFISFPLFCLCPLRYVTISFISFCFLY